jgi:hypothetical protein
MSAKANSTYSIVFGTVNGTQSVFINSNPATTSYPSGAPILNFPNGVAPAAGDPSGSGGQPSPYTLSGDSTGTRFDNTHTIAFTPRGLPCDYVSGTPPTCNTPAAGYFVFYVTSGNATNWAAVVVTRGGRSKVITWDGSAWH